MSVAMSVQLEPPAVVYWNLAEATPEPPSLESEETVTEVPRTFAPAAGEVSSPAGFALSIRTVCFAESELLPAASVARASTW